MILRYAHGTILRAKYGQVVDKRYRYCPFTPRVEDGKLSGPADITGGALVETLNTFPPDLATFDYGYKQIDTQWFIQMHQYKD